jgi:nitrile hydratase accessory protein
MTAPSMPPNHPDAPNHADAPAFNEPWEARAFAMTVALHERGLFTWPEWAAALSQQIQLAQHAGDEDSGGTYYRHWLQALESLLVARGAITPGQISNPASTQGFITDVTSGGSNAIRVQLPSS